MPRVKIQLQDGIKRVVTVDTDATKGATLGANVFLPSGVVATPTTFLQWLGTAPSNSSSSSGGSSGPSISSILTTKGDLATRDSAVQRLGIGAQDTALRVSAAGMPEWRAGATFMKVNDTNVTLTLGGGFATALLSTSTLTLGWTGTLAAPRGGTGFGVYAAGDLLYADTTASLAKLTVGAAGRWLGAGASAPQWNAPAALTKTDDTNVTLALGGSAATSLLNAASLTLGWTGQLGVARGGTNIASYTAGDLLYATGATTLAKLGVGSAGDVLRVSGGAPAWQATSTFVPAAANPTASVGLTAVNGSASTFLRSDGAPALDQAIAPTWTGLHTYSTAPYLWPIDATETTASVSPVRSYVYGDPRRAAFYTSPAWTDFADVPTYVDATHITVPGDKTARYTAFRNVLVVAAASRMQARVAAASFASGVTTITLTTATVGGGAIPTAPIALWLQTSQPSDAPPSAVFSINDVTGYQVVNASTGTGAASRYAAWTLDGSGASNAAIAMVAVSPNYAGTYLSGGFASGTGRGVLYTPPSYSLEIGTSDTARIKISAAGNVVLRSADSARTLDVETGGSANALRGGTGQGASFECAGNNNTAGTSSMAVGQDSSGDGLIFQRANQQIYFGTNATVYAQLSNAGAWRFNAYGAGTLITDGSGNITAVSDERKKRAIRPFLRGLDAVQALRPILYGYTKESLLDQVRDDYAGFSAQNVERAIPEAVSKDAQGMRTLSDRPIVAALVNAVNELRSRLAYLEDRPQDTN